MSETRPRWPGWPAVLLIAALGATAAAAVQAHRATVSERVLAEQALRDFSSFVAWSYRLHVRDAVRASVEAVLGPINHGDALHVGAGTPETESLVHYMPWDEACYCHRPPRLGPRAFLGYTLGADTLSFVVNRYPQPDRGWLVDTTEARLHGPRELAALVSPELPELPEFGAAELAALNGAITRHVRTFWPSDWGYGLIVEEILGERRFLAYRPMARTIGDTIVYAVEYAASDVERFLTDVLDAESLLPEAFTKPVARTTSVAGGPLNRALIDVEVSDRDGRKLFASRATSDWTYAATTMLPPSFASLGVRAQIRPEAADAVLAGGLPRSRLPFLAGLIALAAALSIVAVGQLRRDADLSRLRADFVSSVSHELRTPLAQIRLFLETLRLGRAKTEQDRNWSLENLERETTRLTHLVENVLQFGRASHGVEADGFTEPAGVIDVAAEARAIASAFEPLAAAKATILVEADKPAAATVDADGLRQILLNLLDNAVKYGPKGQTVRVAVQRDGSHVRLAVSDEGPGVPANERRRVWEPFVRGHNGKTRAVGGSGIDLTVVRDVVRRYGGDATIQDAPGGGARFVVRFPSAELPSTGSC